MERSFLLNVLNTSTIIWTCTGRWWTLE